MKRRGNPYRDSKGRFSGRGSRALWQMGRSSPPVGARMSENKKARANWRRNKLEGTKKFKAHSAWESRVIGHKSSKKWVSYTRLKVRGFAEGDKSWPRKKRRSIRR